MQQHITLKVLPSEAGNEDTIRQYLAQATASPVESISGYNILKQSIDARGKQTWINLTLQAFINEPYIARAIQKVEPGDVSHAKHSALIIGAGPAGLFAAISLVEQGIKPILLERGKDVKARRRDLAILNKQGIVNPDSNYCFGEGGAGTYSDGKLYTRSNKRGDINRILNLFVQFGASEQILYNAHPHIGTNKLPAIISAMRQFIEDSGGIFLFDKKVVDISLQNDMVSKVTTSDGDTFVADAYILATGHSARDIFMLLEQKKLALEAKAFALGVRIEHPQQLIDAIQYHCINRSEHLPPAAYALVEQVKGKGVFSFCMCPGGIIATAATDAAELVVNGWSPSKRNNPFANSGIVVTVEDNDVMNLHAYRKYLQKMKVEINSPLRLMYLQQMVEQKAYTAGGGSFVAPAQRLVDFCTGTTSATLPPCSYLPGISSSNLSDTLPGFVHARLQEGLKAFGKKMKGYYTNEAVVVATESRTSSPVRIPRDKVTLNHPQAKNLYPCAEGAGYAGGIVSAAMDGERVAAMITATLLANK